jgi:hypothetical protein
VERFCLGQPGRRFCEQSREIESHEDKINTISHSLYQSVDVDEN